MSVIFILIRYKCIKFGKRFTSGIQSGCDTTATISSNGKRLWHLISVLTFLPIVQQAKSFTNSTWYLKHNKYIFYVWDSQIFKSIQNRTSYNTWYIQLNNFHFKNILKQLTEEDCSHPFDVFQIASFPQND